MPNILVGEVKAGSKIIKDVITPLGGTLFTKGKILLPRDLDILQAFLIGQVEIEGDQGEASSDGAKTTAKQASPKAGAIINESMLVRLILLYMMNTINCSLLLRTAIDR